MMKKLSVILSLVLCSIELYAGGGNGGPIGLIYQVDLTPLSNYVQTYDIPQFNNEIYIWGGAGTSWLTKSFGIGLTAVGGYQMKFKDKSYGAIYTVLGISTIENIIFEGHRTQFVLKYGPGFVINRFVLLDGRGAFAERSEFSIESMLFYVALSSQLKLSEVLRIELSINYFAVPGSEWTLVSGSAPVPGKTKLDGLGISFGIKFGGSYIPSSSGVYIPSPSVQETGGF